MAIKKLQNNFTNPEQSKRLLELGVPVDSADCYYDSWKQIQWRQLADLHNDFFDKYKYYIPCWSVGRLIEIYLTCALEYRPYDYFYVELPSLYLMAFDKNRLIEEVIEIMSEDKMDFSKLEE